MTYRPHGVCRDDFTWYDRAIMLALITSRHLEVRRSRRRSTIPERVLSHQPGLKIPKIR